MPETRIVEVSDGLKWHATSWLAEQVVKFPHITPFSIGIDKDGNLLFDMITLPKSAWWVAVRLSSPHNHENGESLTLRASQTGEGMASRTWFEVWRVVIPARIILNLARSSHFTDNFWMRLDLAPMLIVKQDAKKNMLVHAESSTVDVRLQMDRRESAKRHPALERIIEIETSSIPRQEERQKRQAEFLQSRRTANRSPLRNFLM